MNLVEMMAYNDSQKGYGAPSGNAGIADLFINKMKEEKDEKRRQENVKNQMSQAQQMMQAMSQMKNNSSASKAIGAIDDKEQKRVRGVTGVSDYIPQQEFTIDENGNPQLKIGMKLASPTEQNQMIQVAKTRADMEKEQAKSDLLSSYIKGDIKEGAILKEISSLGITPDEFDMASKARERMRTIIQNQTFSGQPVQIPQIGKPDVQQNLQQPSNQPQQPFRFNTEQALKEQKLSGELQDRENTKQEKATSAIDAASASLSSIDHLLNNINYFGAIEGRMPAGLNQGKREWAKNYDFLEAKNILNVISEMKNQSRTGATGFGQLNREELRVLQNASMKLDKQLDEKTAAKYLNEMKAAFQKIIDREQNGYDGENGLSAGHAQPAGSSVNKSQNQDNDPLGIR